DTGSMNPKDAPNVAASAGTNGSTPAAAATGMRIGTTTDAAAVFDVVSEMTTARTTANTRIITLLPSPSASAAPVPIVSANFVSASNVPKMIPQPNSRMVPQSILLASDQVRVNSRRDQRVGRTNSRAAPSTATTPSSRWSLTVV